MVWLAYGENLLGTIMPCGIFICGMAVFNGGIFICGSEVLEGLDRELGVLGEFGCGIIILRDATYVAKLAIGSFNSTWLSFI
jgi:hypothetical protein